MGCQFMKNDNKMPCNSFFKHCIDLAPSACFSNQNIFPSNQKLSKLVYSAQQSIYQGKKLFFITNFQGCKVMRRRRCSDSLLSASLLPVGRAARKNCESVLRDNFFLISCHILLRTKLLILQTPMGSTIILSTFLENVKLFLKRNSKEIFCFLSFIF